MYKGNTVSVVMSTFNERESIRQCIEDFFSTGFVDEVIIVNNNAIEGTAEEVDKTNAMQHYQPEQGYGHGLCSLNCWSGRPVCLDWWNSY